jgi:hypothetical protein
MNHTVYKVLRISFSSASSITILTPRANESYVGRSLSVIIDYSGPVVQNAMLNFTYTGNPTITDIQPRVLSNMLVFISFVLAQ